jgi:hypothetical protein
MPLPKPSFSVDEDRVAELERRQRHRLLTELLDQLDAEHGPVDEALIEKYARLLEFGTPVARPRETAP